MRNKKQGDKDKEESHRGRETIDTQISEQKIFIYKHTLSVTETDTNRQTLIERRKDNVKHISTDR